jgi:chemotaxis signal transduction protein
MERFRARDLKDVPATIAHAQASYTQALLPLAGKSVGLLDEQRLFHTVGRTLA